MIYELHPTIPLFPNPAEAEPDGLLAIGGDLSPRRLVNAYAMGIFPWYDEEPILWWSLAPRMVLFPDEFRYSKSLRRVVQSGRYEVRIDSNFEQVMLHCASVEREGQDGTWINKDMLQAYCRLHQEGLAHSFESYYQGQLVGGLYGVSLGKVFFGESMFHTMTDASKVAFVRLVDFCKEHDFRLIDAQQETPHLASLGARPISREEFQKILAANDIGQDTIRGRWGEKSVY